MYHDSYGQCPRIRVQNQLKSPRAGGARLLFSPTYFYFTTLIHTTYWKPDSPVPSSGFHSGLRRTADLSWTVRAEAPIDAPRPRNQSFWVLKALAVSF